MGDSPITTPQTPNSEPPTPTTNHTSSKLLNQVLDSSNNEKVATTYLQKENDDEGEDGSNHNDSIYAPIFHKSHLSVTSSCLSVKSMGSSIVDTDMESIFGKPQIPTSIESKPKVPPSKIGQTAGMFRASSSCMSVKSMGSSIVDTDMESIVSKPQIPSTIEGKLVSPPMKNISQINLEEEEEEENIPSFLTGIDYNRHSLNHPDNENSEDDINDDDNLSNNSSSRRGNNVNGDILSFLTEFKSQMMSQMDEIRSSHHHDTENLIRLLKNESNRRSAIEGRLHAQMLLQAETIVAMEIKLLRLEAKLEEKENEKRRRMATEITHRRGDEVDGTPRRSDLDFRGLSNETIDEEDTDVDSAAFHVPGEGTMREIQVTTRTHESAENGRQHRSLQTSRGENHQNMATHGSNPTNIAVISSGVSLASGVTATSFLEETQGAEDQVGRLTGVKVVTRDDRSARSDDGDVEDNETADNEEDDDDDDVAESFNDDGSASTPTQGHRSFFADIQPVTNLESILLNPIQEISASDPGLSTRAVRGDYDGASSLATSATNTTAPSTIVTTTTRGNNSVSMRIDASVNMDEQGQEVELSTSPTHLELQNILGLSGSMENVSEDQDRHPRSRSQSPLTVQSEGVASIAQQSLASASVGTSVWSTAAVAPNRPIRHRRDLQRGEGRQQWANRVVQFTSDQVFSVPPDISEGGDSITMPDELDNFDVAEDFSTRARAWRMEYEARLDAIQKRFNMG